MDSFLEDVVKVDIPVEIRVEIIDKIWCAKTLIFMWNLLVRTEKEKATYWQEILDKLKLAHGSILKLEQILAIQEEVDLEGEVSDWWSARLRRWKQDVQRRDPYGEIRYMGDVMLAEGPRRPDEEVSDKARERYGWSDGTKASYEERERARRGTFRTEEVYRGRTCREVYPGGLYGDDRDREYAEVVAYESDPNVASSPDSLLTF